MTNYACTNFKITYLLIFFVLIELVCAFKILSTN